MIRTFTIITLLPCLLFSNLVWSQGEKTLVKSFNVTGAEVVRLELEGDVEVCTWPNNYLRVEMRVTTLNGSTSILKSLVQGGRYNLIGSTENGVLRIEAPGLRKQVKFGDQILEEGISLKIMIPKDVSVDGLPEEMTPEAEPEVAPLAASL